MAMASVGPYSGRNSPPDFRALVLRVGRKLEEQVGRKRHYTTREVSTACTACGMGWELHKYAHAFYSPLNDFTLLYGKGGAEAAAEQEAHRTHILAQIFGDGVAQGGSIVFDMASSSVKHIGDHGWDWDWNWDWPDLDLSGLFDFFQG
jgi:hypothetical protein